MIFEEKSINTEEKIYALTWDKTEVRLDGNDKGRDVKSIKLEVEGGDMGLVTVEKYVKGTTDTELSHFIVGSSDPMLFHNLSIPIYRIDKSKSGAFQETDKNQLEFNF